MDLTSDTMPVYLECHVSGWCAGHMSIDIDDEALAVVMRRYGFATKTEAVNGALRTLARRPLLTDRTDSSGGEPRNGEKHGRSVPGRM